MKVLFYDAQAYDKRSFGNINHKGMEFTYVQDRLTDENVELSSNYDAVCTFVNCDANAAVIKKLGENGIKFIFQRSAGYNNIDLKEAAKQGIQVFRVPAYSPEGVAEMAATLMVSVNRNIHIAYNRTKIKNFNLNGLEGENIFESSIGVVGAGKIGQCFIRIAKGFGANVLVLDEWAQKNFPNLAEEMGFIWVDKETLFKHSDFISLHAPLLPTTKHLINKDTLKLMKKNAVIVNTARGPLINTSDLLDALDKGQIRGAGLDVYENESGLFFYDKSNELVPDPLLSRLRAHRNVIITSHQAFFTEQALFQIANTTIKNMKAAVANDFANALALQPDGKVLNG